MCGGVAKVPPELEGLAQIMEWMQVQEYAAVTDFVWLRRMILMLDKPKTDAGRGMCPCHQVWIVLTHAPTSCCRSYCALTGCPN